MKLNSSTTTRSTEDYIPGFCLYSQHRKYDELDKVFLRFVSSTSVATLTFLSDFHTKSITVREGEGKNNAFSVK